MTARCLERSAWKKTFDTYCKHAEGKIDDFKVMVRPLKAINLLHQLMKAMLERMSPPAT